MSHESSVQELLIGWEEVYKKGQLTLWVLLAVRDQPRAMKDIKEFIAHYTNNSFSVDDNSMYRALKRYQKAGLTSFVLAPSEGGPERKIFTLTTDGNDLLVAFIQRNIAGILYTPEVMQLIEGRRTNV